MLTQYIRTVFVDDEPDRAMCKVNPRVDFAFKKLFGSEENKDLLISLINIQTALDRWSSFLTTAHQLDWGDCFFAGFGR